MNISQVSIEEVVVLEAAESRFTSNEVLDIRFSNRGFELIPHAVPPFTKVYGANHPEDANAEIFGAFIDSTLAGAITLSKTWNNLASIDNLVVARSFRGQGIATALIDSAKDWASQQQLKGIHLETQTNNAPACKLYARCGFTLGGFDRFSYRTFPQLAHETALYFYWFPDNGQ